MEQNISKPIHAKPSLYAFYFAILKEIALKYGYNLLLHGSMSRDLDLVAVPWVEELGGHPLMVREFAEAIGGHIQAHLLDGKEVEYSKKPHGRICYVININRKGYVAKRIDPQKMNYVDPQYYIDISVFESK